MSQNQNNDSGNKNSAIDQIRDIVFGKNMASYEEKFGQLSHLLQEVSEKIKENHTNLDDRITNEREGLIEQTAAVRSSLEKLESEFVSFKKTVEKKLKGLESQNLKKTDFSEALLELSFRFSDDDKLISSDHSRGPKANSPKL